MIVDIYSEELPYVLFWRPSGQAFYYRGQLISTGDQAVKDCNHPDPERFTKTVIRRAFLPSSYTNPKEAGCMFVFPKTC